MIAELLLKMYKLDYIFAHGSVLRLYMYLGCRITLRSENRVIILAVETLFNIAQQARDRKRKYKVQHTYNKVRLERLKLCRQNSRAPLLR